MNINDLSILEAYCKKNLNLKDAKLSEEYFYTSLPLCVIDSVYSIGVNYKSTRLVVINYCNYFNLKRIRNDKKAIPSVSSQESITEFCNKFTQNSVDKFTNDIFNNRQRTSTKNGILKSEAVFRFCKILQKYGVEYIQDVHKIISDNKFEEEIKQITGQKSGISLQYFFMLCGSNELIKPDRMILRFLEDNLKRKIKTNEAQQILVSLSKQLNGTYPELSPRILDHMIWDYQRNK